MKLTNYLLLVLTVFIFVGCDNYVSINSSSNNGIAASALAGGIIKNKEDNDSTKKYKRKDCPVCKGKGWYMSGDDIKKIECQYCEPDDQATPEKTNKRPPLITRR